jgi:hypothetical protein
VASVLPDCSLTVPSCNPLTQFGFACYGRDKPSDELPPIVCNNPGFPGTSVQGYPATLSCCDLINNLSQ